MSLKTACVSRPRSQVTPFLRCRNSCRRTCRRFSPCPRSWHAVCSELPFSSCLPPFKTNGIVRSARRFIPCRRCKFLPCAGMRRVPSAGIQRGGQGRDQHFTESCRKPVEAVRKSVLRCEAKIMFACIARQRLRKRVMRHAVCAKTDRERGFAVYGDTVIGKVAVFCRRAEHVAESVLAERALRFDV